MAAFVSVIIPTHTGGTLVREAVESVRSQTFDDWEIKIVCDGCQDELADLKADKRVQVVHQKRSGSSVARNVGYSLASGQLLAFLDHDDIMLPRKLELQVAEFEKDPTIGLCHTQFEQTDMGGNRIAPGHGDDVQYEDLLRCKFSVLMSTLLVSRPAMLSAGGFDAKSCLADDIDFVLKVSRTHKLAFIPEVLLQYRVHGLNSSGEPWLQFRETDYVLRGYRKYLRGIGEQASAALLNEGRATNRRVNAEIAMLRARGAAHGDSANWRAIARYLGVALCLSPTVVKANAARVACRSGTRPAVSGWLRPPSR